MTEGVEDTGFHEPQKTNIADWAIEKEMRSLVPNGLHLNQDAVYQRLSSSLPIDEVIEKVKGDFGVTTSDRMIREAREKLGEDYVRLLIEPSVSTRFDDFLAFAEAEIAKGEDLTAWDVRNKFRNSLGKKTVYRVSVASKDDLENIFTNGFVANFYRKSTPQALLENQDGYESMEYAISDLQGRVNVHAGAFASTEDSTLISVSEYPTMAQYAATVQLKERLPKMVAEGNKLYVFPVEIDDFYLLRYGKYLEKTIKGDGVWTDGITEIPYNNPGVEELVEFHIPPESIKRDDVKELDPQKIPQFKFVPKSS